MSAPEPAHAYETVNLLRAGAGAVIELNRPGTLNAFDRQLGLDLLDAVRRCAGDPHVRAVLLRGAGRAFCSGADLRSGFEPGPGGRPDVRRALTERLHPIIAGVRSMPKPVVAAVRGAAAGIGCSLALACDLVLAAESSYLLLAFVNLGLAPDGGSSLLVPARAGLGRAAEMAMLGERVPAARALEWGLVNRVVADGELDAAACALLDRLAAGPTAAYAAVKRQLNASVLGGLDRQLELEAAIQGEQVATADFAEGVAAFASRRAPRFQGD